MASLHQATLSFNADPTAPAPTEISRLVLAERQGALVTRIPGPDSSAGTAPLGADVGHYLRLIESAQ